MLGHEELKGMTDTEVMEYFRTTVMLKVVEPLPYADRVKYIEKVNDDCYNVLGRSLAPDILETLADWLLYEVFSNKAPNKATTEEYPILSKRQLKRRKRKYVLIEKEASLSALHYHIQNNRAYRHKDGETEGADNE